MRFWLIFLFATSSLFAKPIVPKAWWVYPLKKGKIFQADPVLEKYVLQGEKFPVLKPPSQWVVVKSKPSGEVAHPFLQRGYAAAWVELPREGVYLLYCRGGYVTYWNGTPLVGDFYYKREVPHPVWGKKGKNLLLVRGVWGKFQAWLEMAKEKVFFLSQDATLPDLREGKKLNSFGAVILVNAQNKPLEKGWIECGDGKVFQKQRQAIPFLPPLSFQKIPFPIQLVRPIRKKRVLKYPLTLHWQGGKSQIFLSLKVRSLKEPYSETFRSQIDDSVQYYAVLPSRNPASPFLRLYFSLHGASVEASGQVRAYGAKPQGIVVAPTNRRPFGFDWEDWGRLDALEVLRLVQEKYPIHPRRIYLMGHSMGGHGTWHLGVMYPDRFAAIAPSAGWLSLFGYGRRWKPEKKSWQRFFRRCAGISDTESLFPNLKKVPIFILHGEKDDNVPVKEARQAVKLLKTFHQDFVYREVPGVKHWWDLRKSVPGADCVDSPELFDFFDRHVRPEAPRQIEFRTFNPGISAKHFWVTLWLQEKIYSLSKVQGELLPSLREIHLKTENVKVLKLEPPRRYFSSGKLTLLLDGQKVSVNWQGKPIFLEKDTKGWKLAEKLDFERRHPGRYGPFKLALQNRFLFVYGTAGSDEENRAAYQLARFYAHVWWYRANGRAILLPDTYFHPAKYPDRTVVLIGHREMNKAFSLLLPHSPVDLLRGKLKVGQRVFQGKGISCLWIYPRRDSQRAMVVVVGGTSAYGIRAAVLAPFFRSGIHYPDLFAWESQKGFHPKVVGIFSDSWKVEKGEWWMEPSQK